MINLLLGDAGHGKTSYIIEKIKADCENKVRSFLIAPEQQTIIYENEIARLLPPSAQLLCEATNFTRLANKVFREFGGLRYNPITKSGKSLVMYQAICEARDTLKEYHILKGRERSCVKMFLDAIGELKSYGIGISALENALCEIESENLKNKLEDILKIWAIYEAILNERFSDPYDDILLLERKLSDIDYFENCNVYIDSFYSFTGSQSKVLYHILRQAKNVTIAFDCPKNAESGAIQYMKITEARDKIISMCKKLNKSIEIIGFDTNYKHNNQSIKYISENIWSFSAPRLTDSTGIELVYASDEFEECEYTASKIKELILNGAKYSDIAVIMRSSDSYRGIIDYSFKKFNIPFFYSQPTDITGMPAVKMIFSALNGINYYKAEDIVSYIKCGYTDISDEELNNFESYIFRWNIYGKKFKSEEYWASNPDGYIQNPTDYQLKVLSEVNKTREKLISKLEILENVFNKKSTVRECSVAIFEFLKSHKLREKLEKEKESSTREEAYEISQVWNSLLSSLDTLVKICGDATVSTEEYITLLKYALDGTKIGTIPTGVDTVIVGDAPTIRTKSIKHVFILGVNEGVFPADVSDTGFFNDTDKITLETMGIDLSTRSDCRADDELFSFKNAIACSSETVTVSCLKANINGKEMQPSIAFIRLTDIMPDGYVVKSTSSLSKIERIFTKENALENSGGDSALSVAIREYFNLDNKSARFSNEDEKISKNVAKELFGKHLYVSKSKIESFAGCKFKYYCDYVLNLKSSKRISFASNDVGVLNHLVIEKFFDMARNEKFNASTLTDEEIEKIVEDIIDSYSLLICGSENISKKLKRLFYKLKRSLVVYLKNLIKEFENSDFVPEYFELSLTGDGKNAPSALKFKLNEGATVSLSGIVDRVDIYRKNNSTYVRIVDYKSGKKKVTKEHLSSGFGLQMFIYLFTICKLQDCDFKDKLLNGTESIIPAGIIYFPMDMNKKTIDHDVDLESNDAEIIEKYEVDRTIARSGFFLNDIEILNAQSKDKDRKYLPDEKELNKSLLSTQNFEEIYNELEATIGKIGAEILSGDASASPTDIKSENPCTYCEHASICRSSRRRGNEY